MQGISLDSISQLFKRPLAAATDQQSFFSKRREILFGRILLLSILLSCFLIAKDFLVMRAPHSALIDLVILIIILATWVLLRAGYHDVAKSFFLVLMNAIITFYASIVPSDRGIFLFYFPLIAIAFALFEGDRVYLRLVFIVLPVLLFLALVICDFDLLGYKLMTSKLGKHNLAINASIASLMVIFFIEFIMRANRKAEDILLQMAERLRQKNEDVEKINRELDRFVYSTSHDLRAPLLSIQGLVKVALTDTDRSHDKDYFTMISDRTDKLDGFIQEIIEYSRNARTELMPEPTEVGTIVHEVIGNLKFLDNADRIKFEISDRAGVVHLDKGRLKIVMNNIISNSIKYQNVKAPQSWVKVDAFMEGNCCYISVADNGIGILPELQEKVFGMFFRATEKSSGSGLGLYIVKEIVDKMNGKISLKSQFGEHTNFLISIPVANEKRNV
jgi:signal transduction histidine kinase